MVFWVDSVTTKLYTKNRVSTFIVSSSVDPLRMQFHQFRLCRNSLPKEGSNITKCLISPLLTSVYVHIQNLDCIHRTGLAHIKSTFTWGMITKYLFIAYGSTITERVSLKQKQKTKED
jgi:hypothetical protein